MERKYKELLDEALWQYYVETLGLSERRLKIASASRHQMTRGEGIAKLLENEIGLSGKRILDVGSGWGEVAYKCQVLGANSIGIEPDFTSVEVSRALAMSRQENLHFICGSGETLPFSSNLFDVIICHHVIEHVQCPSQVIAELVRVTNLGGHILLAFPNYMMPFEGHYRVPWIPFMPKTVGTHYLKLLGRNPKYLQNFINYVTYKNVLKLLHQHPVTIRCLSYERLTRLSQRQPTLRRHLTHLQLRLGLYKSVTFLLTKRTDV